MNAVVGTVNKEKALVGAFSVIVKSSPVSFEALGGRLVRGEVPRYLLSLLSISEKQIQSN